METKAKNQTKEIACILSAPALQKRKESVLAGLKAKILAKKELAAGYAFQFPGTDQVLEELLEFIKSERSCCSFLVFNLSVSGDQSETWLELTGPEGTKEFITTTMGL